MGLVIVNPRTRVAYEVDEVEKVTKDRVAVTLKNKVLSKGAVVNVDADNFVWQSPDWKEKE